MERKPSYCSDTIVAVATAAGRGGIGVVRLSGRLLLPLALQISGATPQPRLATLVTFRNAQEQPVDQGILLYFPAPHSFTGEDVLELQAHGGPVVLQLLLQRCLELGARLAEPGEFTRRAYLNDKLDLIQAEAIGDLINAATAQAVRSAMTSLSGRFSHAIHELVDRLIGLRSLIEATLDFPDEEIEADEILKAAQVAETLTQMRGELSLIMDRARQGSLLRNGLVVVLAGPPNVGKSSLLNCLAGEERAIVTDIAGTTRDAVRETIQISGIPLHFVDTAGLREPADIVERLGIERSWREIERADVIVQMVDAREGVTREDELIAARLPKDLAGRRIIVHNKCDLAGIEAGRRNENGQGHLFLSALTGVGISLLQQELLDTAGWCDHGEDTILAKERHLLALRAAARHLEKALEELKRSELCAEELRLAQESLNTITGEFSSDDLLGEIFSKFCIGK